MVFEILEATLAPDELHLLKIQVKEPQSKVR